MNTRTAERTEQVPSQSVNRGEVAVFQQPRLPYHSAIQERFGVDRGGWKVLVEATFPNAKTVDSVVMALAYCKARNLDPFKKPVNIVPMWNSSLGREVETVWPGINEIQATAARTHAWAGMDEPKWGPEEVRTFKGRKKGKEGWEDVTVNLTFPTWCSVTVYRLIDGQRFAFTEPVYWTEAYSRAGGAKSELPTDMWVKRPRGQLQKVAKAASLRAAFPEEGEYTAEEMEGKEIEAGGVVIDEPTRPATAAATLPPLPPKQHAARQADFDPNTGEIWDDAPPVGDPFDIPPELDRRPKQEPNSDEAQWLRDLDGALSGCEDMVTLGEQQAKLMAPEKGKVSKEAWARAVKLVQDAVTRLNQTILDAG